ncbi:DUF3572 domain-containing protein [Novosphingobium sp.]|uniref:DUF3572 domain-containing protein n=1 Tax=Novosphingobium sp. TaxID=1874826 RepID=UPI0031CF4EDF
MTILRDSSPQPADPQALALSALGWVLGDEDRAERLIALTGITPDELRDRLGAGEASRREVLTAMMDFLMAYEPDLLACAEALGVPPEVLADAHAKLNDAANAADWGA